MLPDNELSNQQNLRTPTSISDADNEATDPIQTFVFMDLETTPMGDDMQRWYAPTNEKPAFYTNYLKDLLEKDPIPNYIRVLDMAFVAVPRKLFLAAGENMLEEDIADFKEIRQTVHSRTYSALVQPVFDEEQWTQYDKLVDSLDYLKYKSNTLKEFRCFLAEWTYVHNFLWSLKQPVALVAHNGISFDLRVLYSRLKRFKFPQKGFFPEGIRFVDSYLAVREIEERYARYFTDNIPIAENFYDEIIPEKDNEKNVDNHLEERQNDCQMNEQPRTKKSKNVVDKENVQPSYTAVDTRNSETVEELQGQLVGVVYREKIKEEGPETTSLRTCIRNLQEDRGLQNWSVAKTRRWFRNGKFHKVVNDNVVYDVARAKRVNLQSLGNLYESIFHRAPTDTHSAVSDTQHLIQVCLSYGTDFIKYSDTKAAKLPLY